MKTIFFIRHGQTDYNKNGIIQGSGVDSELNEKGRSQAQAFFEFYKNEPFQVVYHSALQRTRQTVQPFIDLGIPTRQTADIDEICWGVHEGKPYEPWMGDAYATMLKNWSEGNLDASLQEGESAQQLLDRLGHFLEHIKTIGEDYILVCSHGRAMRAMLTLLKDEHPREMEKYKHHNTALWKTTFDGQRFLVFAENDTQHLDQ